MRKGLLQAPTLIYTWETESHKTSGTVGLTSLSIKWGNTTFHSLAKWNKQNILEDFKWHVHISF